MQELYSILARFIQGCCKILAKSTQDFWLARKCNNGEKSCKTLARFLHELSKNLVRIIQNSCKYHPQSKKTFARSCNNYPWIIQESCKYYPRVMQESSNIDWRFVQDVMRCVKIDFIFSPKKISETNSNMCLKCPLSTCLPKNRNHTFTSNFQFQTMNQHFLGKFLGRDITWDKDRKKKKVNNLLHICILLSAFLPILNSQTQVLLWNALVKL